MSRPQSSFVDRWAEFWFAPADPIGLHAVRVATGALLLVWLLGLASDAPALFGLSGWFDRQAYLDASRMPGDTPRPLSWSLLFLAGESASALRAVYWAGVAAVALFTLGLVPRLTGVLTWLFTLSLTAGPAFDDDVEALFRLLTLYLAVGYLLLGPWEVFGPWRTFLFARRTGEPARSVGANVALRLIQVNVAILLVTAGLHKLQSGAWWAGVAHWYFLVPPLEASPGKVQQWAAAGFSNMVLLNLSAYATLAWQLTFPAFAWRTGWWRVLLLGGAAAGWVGLMVVYRMPLFGPALLAACLAYLGEPEWRRARGWAARLTARLESAREKVPVGGR